MMTLKEMQTEIIENRKRRGWPSAIDISKTTLGIMEECGEWAKGIKHKDVSRQIDALGDIIVFCLGGLEMLGADAHQVLHDIVTANKDRQYDADKGFH